jgi:riboflavin kinase/FMN adenylyltransferase
MPVQEEIASIIPAKASLITIGVFDGVHSGHRELLSHLVQQAHTSQLLSIAITFKQHPQTLLAPCVNVPMITTLAERISLIKATGVDIVLPLTFDPELAQLDAQPFALLLQHYLKMQGLVLGWDFAMGHERKGSLDNLKVMGKRLGFSVDVIGPVRINGDIVSSTAIRLALDKGDIEKVNAMLGRRFQISGEVITGEGRGAKLGFPTANLDIYPNLAMPANGVYAGITHVNEQTYQSAVFIGRRQTFSNTDMVVEVHLLDYSGDLYRKELKVEIVSRLRDEHKFDTPEALQTQIARDIILTKERLSAALN